MARQFQESIDRNIGLCSPTHWWSTVRRHPLRRRLVVVAPSARAAVGALGGWLFDMTAAGWEVTVLAEDTTEVRALEILGVAVMDLDRALTTRIGACDPDIVAVANEMFYSDNRIHDAVVPASGRGETVLWRGDLAADDDTIGATRHRISVAGRAFKACALRAAGLTADPARGTETLWPVPAQPWVSRGRLDLVRTDPAAGYQADAETGPVRVALTR